MFENIMNFFKKASKKEGKVANNSKTAAKERLHLVLMQDRANVSADFLELMKQEIIEVIKKYIDVDESAIDVRLTNKENADGTNGAPALYANIPILNIKNEARKMESSIKEEKKTKEEDKNKSEVKESENKENKAKETNKKDKSKEENKKDEKEIKEEVSKKDDSNKEDKKEKLEENKEEKTKETKKEEKEEKKEKTEKVQEKVLEQK